MPLRQQVRLGDLLDLKGANMSFEDIPEDKEISYPCPNECGGNVVQDKNQGNMWQCDNCDWMPPQKETDSNLTEQ